MMRLKKIASLGLMIGWALSLSAADNQWVTVFSEDFGGNELSDPQVGNELPVGTIDEDYAFAQDSYGGDYCVLKYSIEQNNWHTGGDHTNASNKELGYFLQVNPNQDRVSVKIYCTKLTGICSGVTFRFSAWFANLMLSIGDGTLPHLSIGIYSDENATTPVSSSAVKDVTLPKCSGSDPNSLDWQQLSMEFEMTGSQDYAYFIVAAVQPESNGFDFAVDDISIEVQQPVVSISNVGEYEYGKPVTLTTDYVNDGFFADMNDVVAEWYYSPDGVTYSKMSTVSYKTSKSFDFTIPSFDKDADNGYYRVKLGEFANISSNVCSLTADFQINETKNKKAVTLCYDETRVINGTTLNASVLNDGDEIDGANDYTYIIHKVEPSTVTTKKEAICVSDTYDGKSYTEGTYLIPVDTILTASGCDSIYKVVELLVTAAGNKFLPSESICQGKTSSTGKLFSTPGVFMDSTDLGCTRYITEITVNPTYAVSKNFTICAGSQIDGETFPTGGVFTRTYNKTTVQGCDSIITATIDVTDKIIETLSPVELCEGDSYTFDGKTYTAPGTYNLSSTSTSVVSGCDSITNQLLVINSIASNIKNPIDTLICYGSKLFGTVYETPTTTPILVRNPTTFTSVKGCDSIVYYNLTVLQVELRLAVQQNRTTICRGDQVEIDVAKLVPANALLSWSHIFSGSNMRAIFTPDRDMQYIVLAKNEEAGCWDSDTVRVSVKDSPVLTIDSVDQKENRVQYHITGGTEPYTVLLDNKEYEDQTSGEVVNSFIGTHKLTAMDSTGCPSTQTFEISPVPITPSAYLTPNGDGVNDRWTIENIDVYSKAKITIYDRTGKVLKVYEGYDNAEGWDGTYQGHLVQPSDYWYVINMPEIDDQYVGHFTLYYQIK